VATFSRGVKKPPVLTGGWVTVINDSDKLTFFLQELKIKDREFMIHNPFKKIVN
jgi:hypothetical protein